MLTPYQIAQRAEHLDGRANIAAINKLFRAQDESHLWPISGRFNATERAIRRIRRINDGCINPGLEYALALDGELSRIVNSEG
jgi:nitroreductase